MRQCQLQFGILSNGPMFWYHQQLQLPTYARAHLFIAAHRSICVICLFSSFVLVVGEYVAIDVNCSSESCAWRAHLLLLFRLTNLRCRMMQHATMPSVIRESIERANVLVPPTTTVAKVRESTFVYSGISLNIFKIPCQ